MTAVDRPASRAARRAALVAVVPPSWLIPMTRPRVGGASDSSNACSARTAAFGKLGGVGGLAQDLGGGQCGMFGGAAAGDDDRVARLERRADLRREPGGGAVRRARAARRSARRAPARPRSCRSCDTAGRSACSASRCSPRDRAVPRAGRSGRRRVRWSSSAPGRGPRIGVSLRRRPAGPRHATAAGAARQPGRGIRPRRRSGA